MAVYKAKKNKFKKCSRKLPPAVNHEYDRKIINFECKLSKKDQERQNLIRYYDEYLDNSLKHQIKKKF